MLQRKRTRRVLLWAGMALAAALLAACSGGGGGGAQQTSAAGRRPSSTAQLGILEPTDGERVSGSSVELKVSLKGGEIVPTTSTKLEPNKGHLHVYLDDNLVSMTVGLDTQIPDVSAGQHVVRVEFVASDHAPFDPRVFASVVFEVTP
jgi:hypothetical protein